MMKKTLIGLISALLVFTSCRPAKSNPRTTENSDGSVSINRIDEDGKATLFNRKKDGYKNVTKINLSKSSRSNPITIDLSDYEGKDLEIQFSCEMLVDDPENEKTRII